MSCLHTNLEIYIYFKNALHILNSICPLTYEYQLKLSYALRLSYWRNAGLWEILLSWTQNIFNTTLVFQLKNKAGKSCLQLLVFLNPKRRVGQDQKYLLDQSYWLWRYSYLCKEDERCCFYCTLVTV